MWYVDVLIFLNYLFVFFIDVNWEIVNFFWLFILLIYLLCFRLVMDFSEGILSLIVVIFVVGLLVGVVEKVVDLFIGWMFFFYFLSRKENLMRF